MKVDVQGYDERPAQLIQTRNFERVFKRRDGPDHNRTVKGTMLQSDDGCNTAYTERRLGYVLDTT